jgi:hypothetical protein
MRIHFRTAGELDVIAITRSFTGLAAAALAASARADLPELLTSLSPAIGEAGHVQTLRIHGTPGERAWILVAEHPGNVELPGIGTLRVAPGAELLALPLGSIPPSGVLDVASRPACDSPLLRAPRFLQAFTVEPGAGALTGLGAQHVLNAASGDCAQPVQAAQPVAAPPSSSPELAFVLPVAALELAGVGSDFVFVAGGTLVERANGYAHLSGVVARASAPQQRLLVELDLQRALHPGDIGHPPVGSPRFEHAPFAASAAGAAIDPQTWRYYEQVDGRLLGLGALQGAHMSLRGVGPALQIGVGANGRNLVLGASAQFEVRVLAAPTSGAAFAAQGTAALCVDITGDGEDCASKAAPDPVWSASRHTHSFYLPEIGKDFAFDPPGRYVELADGTARLTGTIRRSARPSKAFDVDIVFSQRVNAGAAVFPPPGSPKQSLLPRAYVENGGTVDPTAWHYFQHIDGTLTGIDDYAGGLLEVERDGPAFQVGYGANDKNLGWGGSGWLTVKIARHPAFGTPFPSALDSGDVNVDLLDCP